MCVQFSFKIKGAAKGSYSERAGMPTDRGVRAGQAVASLAPGRAGHS